MASVQMMDFLLTVDAAPPAYVAAISTVLVTGGFDTSATLNQADAAEVLAMFPSAGEERVTAPMKAFIRRAIACASAPAAASTALAVLPPTPQVQPQSQLNEIFGQGTSAEAVAAALAAKTPPVDVHEVLGKISCGALPPSMIVELAVWQALTADSEQAKKFGRTAYTFVDFTSTAMLPPWLPRDAVGGRKSANGLADLNPDAGTASLQALSTALQGAVAEPRTLRSIAQWASVYWRYAPLALGTGQMDLSAVIAYHATIMRLAEQERLAKSHGFVALLYDVALRKSWSRRCQQCDPNLSIMAECVNVNSDILETVRSQVHAASAAAATAGFPRGASSSTGWGSGAPDSVLAKAGAAAQAITKRAEAASKEMARAEKSLAAREESLHAATVGGGYKGGGKPGLTNKQKKDQYYRKGSKKFWS